MLPYEISKRLTILERKVRCLGCDVVPYNPVIPGVPGTIYLDPVTGNMYFWDGDSYEPLGGGSSPDPVVALATQTTGAGVYTPSANVKFIEILLGGGGGGGGTGRRNAAASARSGGKGGFAGLIAYRTFIRSEFGGSVAYVVGAGGIGAPALTGGTIAAGVNGGNGGNSNFGTLLYAYGGPGGAGGTAVADTTDSRLVSSSSPFLFPQYQNASTTNSATPQPAQSSDSLSSTAGGSGGGVTGVNSAGGNAGSRSVYTPNLNNTSVIGGLGGAAGVNNGAPGSIHGSINLYGLAIGTGGGGGGSDNATGSSGSGGLGTGFCSGGGGAGASANVAATSSGAGGNGAAGFIIILEYY